MINDTPHKKNNHRGEALKFFLESLEIETDECIIWEYATNSYGYGHLGFENKIQIVHRLALKQKIGEAPKGKPFALHSCRNKACFNYRHLRWGSQVDNCADKIKDGTNVAPRGTSQWHSKLTENQVLAIRADKRPQTEIAKDYGVARSNISLIKTGRNWAWL